MSYFRSGLGKWDFKIGVFSGGLCFYFLLLPAVFADYFSDYLFEDGGALVFIPAFFLVVVSVVFGARKAAVSVSHDTVMVFTRDLVIAMLLFVVMGIIAPVFLLVGLRRNKESNGVASQNTKGASKKDESTNFPFPSRYSGIDSKAVYEKLSEVTSSVDVDIALKAFPSAREGYMCCKPWLRHKLDGDFSQRIRALFVAFYFDDKEFCDSVYAEGYVCSAAGAASLLDLVCHDGGDDLVQRFISRYTNIRLSSSREEYAKNIPWYKYVDSDDDVAYDFYRRLGIKPMYGDSYQTMMHWSGSFANRRTSSYEYCTKLSAAVEANDIATVRKLLKWGVNPNQYLHCTYTYPPDDMSVRIDRMAGRVHKREEPDVSKGDHLISHIKTKEMFNILVAAGMDRTPPSSVHVSKGVTAYSECLEKSKFA
jgi:hypothetical protein